ncbi:hypothetical protein RUM44_012826 [Polyplax serrata]|uniref:Uncharacterized protein n=1 Tax=Polyplax serrata TaxID=468196 RepID=A0ABR1BH92_POLSC
MHWITFVLGSALLVTARTKTAEASEQFDLTQQESPREIYEEKGRSVWSPIPEKEIYAVLNRMNEKGAAKLQKKRALSALSRWKPLGSLGIRMKAVHRTSSRAPMISMVPEMNLISPESEEGLRPLGQPLRWGRKR